MNWKTTMKVMKTRLLKSDHKEFTLNELLRLNLLFWSKAVLRSDQ